MPFEKGHEKKGGRKKGTKNQRTLKRAAEVLLEKGINPTEKLIALAESPEADITEKSRIWTHLNGLIEPKNPVLSESPKVPEEVAPTAQLLTLVTQNTPKKTAEGGE